MIFYNAGARFVVHISFALSFQFLGRVVSCNNGLFNPLLLVNS